MWGVCRLETVLYSLTGCTRELLQLRQPCAMELQVACAWASASCSKPAPKPAQGPAEDGPELSQH